jgi:ribosome biogenesis GTPase
MTEILTEGQVVSHLGQGLAVESPSGDIVLCQTRRQLGAVTVGDRVLWTAGENRQGRVEKILPRRSLLTRPAHGGRVRPVAANLDRIIVVVAPEPEPDWLLVDQYVAACEHRLLAVSILINKVDRLEETSRLETALKPYREIGYPCHLVSAKSGHGLNELRTSLMHQCSMLAGQSGVGKSSLTNVLLPGKDLKTRELSEKAGLGRHTTTAAMLYHLPEGGDLIDSPGVAVFGLAEMSAADLAWGFSEFRPYLDDCQFNDCRHIRDKGCAVRAAVENRSIAVERYERFLKLLTKMHLA